MGGSVIMQKIDRSDSLFAGEGFGLIRPKGKKCRRREKTPHKWFNGKGAFLGGLGVKNPKGEGPFALIIITVSLRSK